MKKNKSLISAILLLLTIFSMIGTSFGAALISVSFDKDTANVGDQVVMTVTITNTGPENLTDIKVYAPLPDGLKYVSHNTDVEKIDYTQSTGIWNVGNLKLKSKLAGVKHLYITATVQNEIAGKTINAYTKYNTVSYNNSGIITPVTPLPQSDAATLTVNSVTTTNGNINNTNTPPKAVIAKAIKNTKSKIGINNIQPTQGNAYEVNNATNPNSSNPLQTLYTILGGLAIAIMIGIGYFKGIKGQ